MSTVTAAQQYRNQAIQTAPPVKIVAMLFERAILGLSRAEDAIEHRHNDAASRHLGHSTEILMELMASLDHDAGGEVAMDLERLYQFSIAHLSEAGIRKDREALAQVRTVLQPLYEAWDELARR